MGAAAGKSFIKRHSDCQGTDRKMQLRAAIRKTPKDCPGKDGGSVSRRPGNLQRKLTLKEGQAGGENASDGPALRPRGELLAALQLHAVP